MPKFDIEAYRQTGEKFTATDAGVQIVQSDTEFAFVDDELTIVANGQYTEDSLQYKLYVLRRTKELLNIK